MQATLEPLLTRGDRPVGVKGCVIGFVEISWHGLIIAGFHVNTGPRGLFVEFRSIERQVAAGYGVARLKTVREQQAFKTQVLAALMKAYPEDFEGFEAEKPCV